MARAAAIPEPPLFSMINVTPFIDVMLVLLIVIILDLPTATHKVPIDLPPPGIAGQIEEPHLLAIDRGGALSWDGRAVADAELPALLTRLRNNPAGVLHMQTDPDARYDRFATVLTTVKHSGIARLGFIGNHPFVS